MEGHAAAAGAGWSHRNAWNSRDKFRRRCVASAKFSEQMKTTSSILPVKRLDSAHSGSRVCSRPDQRKRLAEAIFLDMLGKLRRCRTLDDTLVVTADPSVARQARWLGHRWSSRARTGPLRGRERRRPGGAGATAPTASRCCPPTARCWIRVSSTTDLGTTPRSALIVPDRHGTGTNALVLSPPDAFEPAFGPDSCARHVAPRPRGRHQLRAGDARVAGSRPRHARGHGAAPRRPAARARAGAAHRPGAVGAGGRAEVARPAEQPAAAYGAGLERPRAAGAAAGGPRRDLARATSSGRWSPTAAAAGRRDVVVLSQKVVSKAEGRLRRLADVEPGERAAELAERADKDPRAGRADPGREPRRSSAPSRAC